MDNMNDCCIRWGINSYLYTFEVPAHLTHAVLWQSYRHLWLVGEEPGVARRSGTFISAHAAYAGLIMFWAGSFTLYKLARYDVSAPMGQQGLVLLPHLLATLGFGLGEDGE